MVTEKRKWVAISSKILNLGFIYKTYCSFCAAVSITGSAISIIHVLDFLQQKNYMLGIDSEIDVNATTGIYRHNEIITL